MRAAEDWAESLLIFSELDEHLARARAALQLEQHGPKEVAEDERPRIVQVLDVAEAALASLTHFAGGLQRNFVGGAGIDLTRDGSRVTVTVLGDPLPHQIAAFLSELADRDRRLLDAAELLGLLLHLCTGWVTVGFAPPLLLKTLMDSGPRILELGAALSRRPVD